MPISVLKIDKKIRRLHLSQPLLKSIISLAVSFRMLTVSEGVEDKNQLDLLLGNGAFFDTFSRSRSARQIAANSYKTVRHTLMQ